MMAASCGKEKNTPIDTAEIQLSFRATYDGQPLVLNQKTYDYVGKAVRFSKINFYVSELVIGNEDGDTELSEIEFVDLTSTHNTEAGAAKGTIKTYPKVPVGSFNQLKFGIGVAADLNRTSPADYSTNHPLGADNSGEYWEAWNSYIFVKIEGQYDDNNDGTFNGQDISFAYHAGRDNLYQRLELDQIQTLEAGKTTTLNFELDIKKLLSLPKGDLITLEPHDPNNQLEEMVIIMRNFEKALQLK
jgi:hypothetical protein